MQIDDQPPAHLQIDQDLTHEERQWKAERISRVIMLLIATAGLLGLLGRGPLSYTSVRSADGTIEVRYHRFERALASSDLVVSVKPPTDQTPLAIWIDQEYLGTVKLERITPEPNWSEVHADRVVLYFDAGPEGAVISLRQQALGPGLPQAQLGIEAGSSVSFRQIVYP